VQQLLNSPYGWLIAGTVLILILFVIHWIWRSFTRAVRRRRSPTIHPKLQKYNVDQAALQAERRELARGIIATSTGNRLAGYRVVRQVEAVFVEGLQTPEDALVALKALAVQRGANAVLNVQTQRTAAGKCSASGDAVEVTTTLPRPQRSS
jgi:uncharacterized protein YbjQ (UPF0145 family)